MTTQSSRVTCKDIMWMHSCRKLTAGWQWQVSRCSGWSRRRLATPLTSLSTSRPICMKLADLRSTRTPNGATDMHTYIEQACTIQQCSQALCKASCTATQLIAAHMNGTGLNAKLRHKAERDTGKLPLSHGTSSNVTRDKPKCEFCFRHQSGQAPQN